MCCEPVEFVRVSCGGPDRPWPRLGWEGSALDGLNLVSRPGPARHSVWRLCAGPWQRPAVQRWRRVADQTRVAGAVGASDGAQRPARHQRQLAGPCLGPARWRAMQACCGTAQAMRWKACSGAAKCWPWPVRMRMPMTAPAWSSRWPTWPGWQTVQPARAGTLPGPGRGAGSLVGRHRRDVGGT